MTRRDRNSSAAEEGSSDGRYTRRGLVRAAGASLTGGVLLGGDVPTVPDAVGVAAAAREPYRPDYHFTPQSGWMNDPNGLVYHDGTYHLFYQAGESRRRWDHATSTDLHEWTEQGTKIAATDSVQAFSGGAVVDAKNTSGFGTDAMVCLYTGHHDDGTEDQRLAYSTDGGETVTKYADNPIIDTNHDDWRDPVPFWYEPAGEWRLVVCRVSDHTDDGTRYPAGIEVWRSSDLADWTYLSTYESSDRSWECPDLYRLPVKGTDESRWVMSMSVDWDHHEYHVGRFDGTTFTADNTLYADDGHDFYAAQTWSNEPESDDRLATAWMSAWDYADEMPDPGWTGHQLFPRRIELAETDDGVVPVERPDDSLVEAHDDRLASLSDEPVSPTADPLEGESVEGRHLDIDATFDPGDADSVTLTVRADAHQETRVTYDVPNEKLIVDRSDAGNLFPGTSDGFPERGSAPVSTRSDGTVRLRVLVDATVVEVYANDGRRTLCQQIYPDGCADGTSLTASGGSATLTSLTAHGTNSEPCRTGRRLSDGTTYRITNYNSGLSLEVEDASTAAGAAVVQGEYDAKAHQRWTARRTDAGDWYFENVNSGKVIDVEGRSTGRGAHCVQRPRNDAASQRWSLTDVGDGLLHAKNRNSQWALDVDGGSTSTGAAAMQWEYWAGDNQKWEFERA